MLRAADFFFFFAFNFDAGGFHERSQRMLQTEYMQGNTCVAKIWFSHEKQKQNTQPNSALNYLVVLLI